MPSLRHLSRAEYADPPDPQATNPPVPLYSIKASHPRELHLTSKNSLLQIHQPNFVEELNSHLSTPTAQEQLYII